MSFQQRLSAGEFVLLGEMNTPKGVDISEFMTNARRIKGRLDAIIVPDMDNGIMRMSALAGGALLQQQGIETIIHVYGRDRNKMALQGDILAAHVLGIQNLIVVRGEQMAYGDHHDAKVVNDLDELGLLGAIQSLQRGVDLAGCELNGRPAFTVGYAIGPYVDEKAMDAELDLARKAVAAGAQYLTTPPVYDVNHFGSFLDRAKGLGVPIIATVFLIKSVGVARYIAQNEPGAHISEDLIRRIRQASDRDLECLRIAGETIASLKPLVQGVQIITLGWEHRLPVILDQAGLR
ncbi:MAG: methylenetetrahydrofolate reductase [Deltaproteobacteria bacterium]|nr:methylenetetrahydrofolate reductase [Deltaproteobacteria bacterium]MBF0523697.1 methylenetetrahydrofolate reductase [Deltaproteobacteria bacterium]